MYEHICMWLPSVRTCGSRHTGQAAPPHENIHKER